MKGWNVDSLEVDIRQGSTYKNITITHYFSSLFLYSSFIFFNQESTCEEEKNERFKRKSTS